MQPYFRPYQFLLLATVSLAMTFLMKINKQSFYHHFFKVIEEVELRNSHLLPALPPLETIWWEVQAPLKGPALAFWLFLAWVWGGALVGIQLDPAPRPVWVHPTAPGGARRMLPPVRAPAA